MLFNNIFTQNVRDLMKKTQVAALCASLLFVGSAVAQTTVGVADVSALSVGGASVEQLIADAQEQGESIEEVVKNLLADNPELAEQILTVALNVVGSDTALTQAVLVVADEAGVPQDNIVAIAVANNVDSSLVEAALPETATAAAPESVVEAPESEVTAPETEVTAPDTVVEAPVASPTPAAPPAPVPSLPPPPAGGGGTSISGN
jgi:hypothetical protein